MARRRKLPAVLQEAQLVRIEADLQTVFTPSAPVRRRDLFAGRWDQITRVIGAVGQVGQHAILFGERGVGKTSLASLIHEFWNEVHPDPDLVTPRVNCNATDSFATVWIRAADAIAEHYVDARPDRNNDDLIDALDRFRSTSPSTDSIRRLLSLPSRHFVLIFDEFDRLCDANGPRLFADTIKTLSDQHVAATLVMVGVADTIDGLIAVHASIDRNLVQVLMPRMTPDDIKQIVTNGLTKVGMKIDNEALDFVAFLAQGLPPYAHLLGQHAALHAIRGKRLKVGFPDVIGALQSAAQNSHETTRNAYAQATGSHQPGNVYKQVLLACALTPKDSVGNFKPADVRDGFSWIMKKPRAIADYVNQMHALCTEDRGGVLRKQGKPRRQVFRFADPLLAPYVTVQGVIDGMLPRTPPPAPHSSPELTPADVAPTL